MQYTVRNVTVIYLSLTLINTMAASFIWGINTLFLLNAGLNNLEAFAANAFFTLGQVLFEIPTGIFADTKGRRSSFLFGALTLVVTTLLYLWMWKISAPFWAWAIVSIGLGLGFTFFSGATEAWIVDALTHVGYEDNLESIFAKSQIVIGIGMLTGSVAGGVIAEYTNLSVPYILRAILLSINFILAFTLMFDIGFKSKKDKSLLVESKSILSASYKYGLKNPPVRWVMLAGLFSSGVGIYAFYALQPYLLQLYGNPKAYTIAGLAAALVAAAQIVGGLIIPYIRKLFRRRTSILIIGALVNTGILFLLGFSSSFWLVIILISLWSCVFAATIPIHQAYINSLIPSQQRATILSFDSMIGSSGGVIFQPVLGKVADVWGYGNSYLVCALINVASWPFLFLAKKEKAKSDFY